MIASHYYAASVRFPVGFNNREMSDSEDSEELDKETIGKRVSKKLPRKFGGKKMDIDSCVPTKQVAETLDPEKLQEYRDIFSFFDRSFQSILVWESIDLVSWSIILLGVIDLLM